MIKEVKMYTVICDNCGVDFLEGDDVAAWNDSDFVLDSAEDSGWIRDQHGKDYCSDCFTWDDNDELVLREVKRSIEPKEDRL